MRGIVMQAIPRMFFSLPQKIGGPFLFRTLNSQLSIDERYIESKLRFCGRRQHMKLGEAQKITSMHLNALSQRRRTLKELLEEGQASGSGSANFDRVEITKELSAVEKEYEQTQDVADELSAMSTAIQNAEVARQQGEAIAEAAEEILKILEVFRRIAKGDKVPATDEKKLMEYSQVMYMSAKNMALMNQNCERKKHKSLWEEEPAQEEPVDPFELAANTEVGEPLAGVTAVSRSSDTGAGAAPSA